MFSKTSVFEGFCDWIVFFFGGWLLQIFRNETLPKLPSSEPRIPETPYANAMSQAGLAALIESVGSVEAAGEAIYSTLFEAAPSISVHNGSLDDILFFENRSAGTGKSLGLQKKIHLPNSKPSLLWVFM